MAKKVLVSNKVYDAIQVPTEQVVPMTGTVLYANQFSGISPVPMPKYIADVLNSDFGEIGNNILVQLNQKVQGLPDGPWFVDSRDGVIYIHNRKFQEDPVHHYSFQQGNGELLSVDFQTQYVNKTRDGSISSGISPDKKFNLDVAVDETPGLNYSDYLEANMDYNQRIAALGKAYDDYKANKLPYDQLVVLEDKLNDGRITLFDKHVWSFNENLHREEERRKKEREDIALQTEKVYKEYQAAGGGEKGGKLLREKAVDEILANKDLENEVQRMLIEVTQGKPGALQQITAEMKSAAMNGTLEQFMKRYFGAGTHVFDEKNWATSPQSYTEVYVDPRKYASSSFKAALAVTTDKTITDNAIARNGFEELKRMPDIKVISKKPYEVREDAAGKTYDYQVRVFKKVNQIASTPQYKLIMAYYTRKYGSDGSWRDVERRVQSVCNSNKKTLERKLVCRMTCIGNPKLESSHIITLSNVGSKWSGPWYIKSCSHQMINGQGYTCVIELVKNLSALNTSGASVGIDTEGIVDSKILKPQTGPGSNFNFTREEVALYTGLKSNTEKMDFIVSALAARDKDIKYNTQGIALQRSTTSSSGEGTKHDFYIDPEVSKKITLEDHKKYGRKAAAAIRQGIKSK